MDDQVTIPSRNGRYEDDDDFNIIGGYTQVTYKVSEKLIILKIKNLN